MEEDGGDVTVQIPAKCRDGGELRGGPARLAAATAEEGGRGGEN